jgi:hypothetical protein
VVSGSRNVLDLEQWHKEAHTAEVNWAPLCEVGR